MPAHTHSATSDTQGNHTHAVSRNIDISNENTGNNVAGHDTLGNYNGIEVYWTSAAGAHAHYIQVSSTGQDSPHNNMPPYTVTYIWQRTA